MAKREAPIVSPIPGEDLKFLYANVHPRGETGETVIVSSPEVPAPVAVRYGWADYPL